MIVQAEGKDEEEKEDGEITVEERQQKQRDDLQAAQLELKVCSCLRSPWLGLGRFLIVLGIECCELFATLLPTSVVDMESSAM